MSYPVAVRSWIADLLGTIALGLAAAIGVIGHFGLLLDPFFARACSPVIHLWCRVTGRSNFALARLAICIGGVGIVTVGVLGAALEPSAGNVFFASLGAFGWGYMTSWALRVGKAIERGVESGASVINMTEHDASSLRFFRIFSAVLGILALATLTIAPNGLYGLFSLGCYALTHLHGRRKSVFARATDAVRRWVRAPRLAPSPVPA